MLQTETAELNRPKRLFALKFSVCLMGAWARWRERACMRVCVCASAWVRAAVLTKTAGASRAARSLLQFFHKPVLLFWALCWRMMLENIWGAYRLWISGSLDWRSTWFKVRIGSLRAGCLSYQRRKNADGPVRRQRARGAGVSAHVRGHVRERVLAAADDDLGSSVVTLIQHTSRHQSP